MTDGGCFCGKVRIHYSGQPTISALCHCSDCRKLTGTLYTYSFVVNSADVKITGSAKEVPKQADSGNQIKNYFCPDCGTPLYGYKAKADGDRADDITILRAGIFDDIEMLNQHKPEVEIYTDGRVKWMSPAEGAGQFTGMPPFRD